MPDMEKVISEFTECVQRGGWTHCGNCGYKNANMLLTCEPLAKEILALLKEQEAKNGEWITIWQEDDPDTSTHARCSICNRISERPLGRYCKWCGAKMNQEWGVDG